MSLADAAAAATRHAGPVRVRLRPTMASDLAWVLALEQQAAARGAWSGWTVEQHEAVVRFPDFRHCVIESGAGLEAAGFAVLAGCHSTQRAIEVRRLLVHPARQGIGRAALRVLKKMAFDDLNAHRLWLEAAGRNLAAQALGRSEGFVQEGVLRDAILANDGFDARVIMGLLDHEFLARRQAGREVTA